VARRPSETPTIACRVDFTFLSDATHANRRQLSLGRPRSTDASVCTRDSFPRSPCITIRFMCMLMQICRFEDARQVA